MKRVITIVGGGQSGLQLGNGLLAAGYDVRLVQDRKGDDIRTGKVMSSQCMFDKALSYERELGLNFWDKECPTVDSISFTVPAPDGSGNKAIDWNGLLDKPAQAVDQRLKFPRWMQELEKRGFAVTYLPVDRDGRVNPQAVKDAIRPETVLITIMHANNELGTLQPLEEIGRIAADADVYFHTDAVQSAGKIPIDVKVLQLDMLSISGHKLYAPKGIGALYVRGGTRLRQLLYGGRHQRGARPGTENVAGIVALGKAAQLAQKALAQDSARLAALRDQLETGLLSRIPHTFVNGAAAPRTPNTTNIVFPGIEGESLIIALDLKGIACSTGAACSSGAIEPSHVLTAIGLSPEDARASIRFSLGKPTTAAEIDQCLRIVPGVVEQLRELSPTYRKLAETR